MKDPSKHLNKNEKKWDRWARSYDEEGWLKNRLRQAQRDLVAVLDVKADDFVLDIGCGTGYALGLIAANGGQGQYYGVDLSQEMINKAKRNYAGKANFHFLKANAEDVPLPSDTFDVIICSSSFHHYLNPQQAVAEMKRLLKPAGMVYIFDITADHWWPKILDKIAKLIEPEHVKIYSSKEHREIFENAGLRPLESIPIGLNEKTHVAEK